MQKKTCGFCNDNIRIPISFFIKCALIAWMLYLGVRGFQPKWKKDSESVHLFFSFMYTVKVPSRNVELLSNVNIFVSRTHIANIVNISIVNKTLLQLFVVSSVRIFKLWTSRQINWCISEEECMWRLYSNIR